MCGRGTRLVDVWRGGLILWYHVLWHSEPEKCQDCLTSVTLWSVVAPGSIPHPQLLKESATLPQVHPASRYVIARVLPGLPPH